MSVPGSINRSCAVFFDRDGTLMEEVNYCGELAKVKVYAAGVPEAMRKPKENGMRPTCWYPNHPWSERAMGGGAIMPHGLCSRRCRRGPTDHFDEHLKV